MERHEERERERESWRGVADPLDLAEVGEVGRGQSLSLKGKGTQVTDQANRVEQSQYLSYNKKVDS